MTDSTTTLSSTPQTADSRSRASQSEPGTSPAPSACWPSSAFLDPSGANIAEVRTLLTQAVELTVQELGSANHLPTVPLEWKELRAEQILPQQPVSEAELLSVCQTLLHGSMNPAHPRYLGHMDPLPSTGSVIASLIIAAVNNNLLSREMSPIFSDLEQRLLRELAGLFGLPETAGGMLQSGGTLCNLQALTVARNSHFDIHTKGLVGLERPPVLFASELCHSSIQKAAMVMGLGTAAVISIKTDDRCRMCPEALRAAILLAQKNNQQPFAVVATAGTTVTGNIDPLPEIAAICQEFNLWLHVDASYGGAIIFSDRERHRLQGTELADSITFNPQKWCYVTKVCALVMFRNEQVLDRHFRIPAPYMSLHETQGHTNLGEWGIQGTRAPDIAKWWLTLLQLGRQGLGALVDQAYVRAAQFLEKVQERDFLELASQPDMNILCFRDLRNGHDAISRAKQNTSLQKHLMSETEAFVSLPHFRESRWLKAVILNPFTTEADFAAIFQAIDDYRA